MKDLASDLNVFCTHDDPCQQGQGTGDNYWSPCLFTWVTNLVTACHRTNLHWGKNKLSSLINCENDCPQTLKWNSNQYLISWDKNQRKLPTLYNHYPTNSGYMWELDISFQLFYFPPLRSNFHIECLACQHLDQGSLLRHCGKLTETSVLISPQCISNEVVWGYTISVSHFYTNRSSNTDNNKEKQYSTVSSEK